VQHAQTVFCALASPLSPLPAAPAQQRLSADSAAFPVRSLKGVWEPPFCFSLCARSQVGMTHEAGADFRIGGQPWPRRFA
jgi:hypothetical protein